MRRFGVFAAMLLAAQVTLLGCESDDPEPPPIGVYPLDDALGQTYEDWALEYWAWVWSMPQEDHALIDGDCGMNQSQDVFFLGGGYATIPWPPVLDYVGTCAVPADTPLFFPVVAMGGVLAPECLGDTECGFDRISLAEYYADMPTWCDFTMDVTLNGYSVADEAGISLLDQLVTIPSIDVGVPPGGHSVLWVEDECGGFDIGSPFEDGNVCGWTGSRYFSSTSYFVMLEGLPPGTYELVITGGCPDWDTITTRTYTLDIE